MLFLCTGNICRSPMAEAMLSSRLALLGVDARVSSAGVLEDGMIPPADALAVMADLGLDTTAHRSRRVNRSMLADADLILGMARAHVQEAVELAPAVFPKSFTLKEFVRRAEAVGPRSPGQPFDEWVAKVHAGRSRMDLLGHSADDVADPIGLSRRVYERTADEIHRLVSRLVELGWGAW